MGRSTSFNIYCTLWDVHWCSPNLPIVVTLYVWISVYYIGFLIMYRLNLVVGSYTFYLQLASYLMWLMFRLYSLSSDVLLNSIIWWCWLGTTKVLRVISNDHGHPSGTFCIKGDFREPLHRTNIGKSFGSDPQTVGTSQSFVITVVLAPEPTRICVLRWVGTSTFSDLFWLILWYVGMLIWVVLPMF